MGTDADGCRKQAMYHLRKEVSGMQYEKHCLDKPEYFPAQVTIPKADLIRQVYDGTLAGASSIEMLHGSTAMCVDAVRKEIRSEEKKKACSCVIRARKSFTEQCEKIRELEKGKASKEEIALAKAIRDKHLQELSDLTASCCTDCAYSRVTKSASHRLNFARYGSKRETLANSRVFIALNMLAQSSAPDGNDLLIPSDISIRKLANLCRLHQNTTRKALQYWAEEGVIIYARFGRGQYKVAFTKTYVAKRALPAKEGGAGYIALPFEAVQLYMMIDHVDVARLFLLVMLSVDAAIYNRSFALHGKAISIDSPLLRYVARHKHGSIGQLLDRFNHTVAGLSPSGGNIILHARNTEDTYLTDERYAHIDINISQTFCPRQKEMPYGLEHLTRKLLPGSLRQIDKARKAFPDYKASQMGALLPDHLGNPLVSLANSLHPHTRSETLVPALEQIQNSFGTAYIKDALVSTFQHKSSCFMRLFTDVFPGTDEFQNTINTLSAYMLATARALKDQVHISRAPFPVAQV